MCVYFIQAEPGGLIKIGFSINPSGRLYNLQMSCPVPLKIIALIKDAPQPVEVTAHYSLSKWRKYGEWFEPSKEVLEYMQQNAADFEPPTAPRFEEDDLVLISGQYRKRCKGYSRHRAGRCANHVACDGDYCIFHQP